ncbi:NADPH:quinone reductase-like Zn-dependent oxidoreductase [Sediminihabitans luteus]|uniref:NADPH:quinone reductase-like Zn-dependent oxidoreductase n=1 Tax=Sediminihabitans luteus TaxID=1138585 RepID=A0A2M9CEH6_9CELL|nr:zinc-binding dehydrogenase [Sediminihabitans luteus]PJJ70255.1 NADPH:quinone reductase-like Zn-dependent oxidoreductase [Sediminihabitans luteus]GII97726.1 Zn-dependent oxidoreductase [Sediminihabitans luteus]
MLAAYVTTTRPDSPLDALEVGDRPAPEPREHWTTVDVRAASLNHHDLWSLRGVGLPDERLPMILGTDAAGVAPDGTEVVVHGVIGADGHGVGPRETRSLLSEKYQGTLAEQVSVPTANLVPKPAGLGFVEAACLPTAWLTAYRMLFRAAELAPGDRVLVQGAGGGLTSAAITLAAAAGIEVFATSRSADKRERAVALGAAAAFEPGARLPSRVDAVVESVGAATWSHSVRSLRPGGTIAVAGATSGDPSPAELTRIFFNELRVQGVTMGTRDDLAALLRFVDRTGVRPTLDTVLPLARAAEGFARIAGGDQFGKVVLEP